MKYFILYWGGNFLDAAVALDSDDDLDSDDGVDEARLKERVDGAAVRGTAGDNIGYAVHASRLKEMLEDDTFPVHAALTLAPANVLAPPPPAYTIDEPQRLTQHLED